VIIRVARSLSDLKNRSENLPNKASQGSIGGDSNPDVGRCDKMPQHHRLAKH
jgi:hypothetical protein